MNDELASLEKKYRELECSFLQLRDALQDMATQHYALNKLIPQTQIDEDGYVVYANDVFAEWLGLTIDQIVGENLDTVLKSEFSSVELECRNEKLSKGEVWEGVVKGFFPDGTSLWEQRVVVPVAEGIGDVKFLCFHNRMVREKERESHYKSLELDRFQNLGVFGGVVYSPATNLISLNHGMGKILQQEKGEMTKDEFERMMHPEDIEVFDGMLLNSCGIEALETPIRMFRKNGELRFLFLHCEEVNDEQTGDVKKLFLFSDRTEEEINRNLLKQELEAHKDWLESTDELYWSVDPFHSVQTYNQNFCKTTKEWFGEALEEGDDFLALGDDAFIEIWEAPIQSALEGAKCKFNFEIHGKIWSVKLNPILEIGGDISGVSFVARDVTVEWESQKILKRAKEKAEEANRVKTNFLSTMSHEMRTPLNAVVGLTDLLLQESPNNEQLENLNLLRVAGGNLLHLINDVIDFNQLESGNVTLHHNKTHLVPFLTKIVEDNYPQAKENGTQIHIEIQAPTELRLVLDQVRVSQVIQNLLSNAIKFSPGGEVWLRVFMLDENEQKVFLKIMVIDNGIGIATENQKGIFEHFKQASQGDTRQYGGTGLGLSIAKKLLEAMGSAIELKSDLGRGASFAFSIWFQKAGGDEIGANKEMNEEILFGKRMLLVDDNHINLKLGAKILEKSGIQVDLAFNGLEAVELFDKNVYDAVLMDLQMPVMDGFEATRKIRQMDSGAKVPIIALTANAYVEREFQRDKRGLDAIATKPYRPEELLQKLRKCLHDLE